jgi:hypothetical protein
MEASANSFGVESEGMFQIRGNGCLILTDDVVAFDLWVPRKKLRIPRSRIRRVEVRRQHLGSRRGSACSG